MKQYRISWFDEFKCLGGSCPQTCCKGWVIPLEKEDCIRLKKISGRLGIRLFFATGGWTRAKFNPDSTTCPFHDKQGLCRIQKEKGHETIPWACQSYPRFFRNYGEFEECSLDLSCIAAARMMLDHLGDMSTVETDHEPYTQLCTTNDDQRFLEHLMMIRQEMTEAVFTKDPGTVMTAMYEFAADLQDKIGKDETYGYDLSFRKYLESREDPEKTATVFPLPAGMLRRFLDSSLCHPRLKFKDPVIYGMLTAAKMHLRKYKDEKSWAADAGGYLGSHPELQKVLASYAAYYLHQNFLRTYETYSFRRQVALGIIHTNMVLLLFITLACESDGDKNALAKIMAAYNRRAYFNDSIQDEMYRIFDRYKKDA
ncbi:MAG: flagellin lysine-N-methylase [Lachnospiraceae bacterium]|nr:flagellin lysine-N-methylase [Lachnospiraceae bacterium]